MAKRKRTNNDLQNTTYKTKDRAIRISLKGENESMCPGLMTTTDTRRITLF